MWSIFNASLLVKSDFYSHLWTLNLKKFTGVQHVYLIVITVCSSFKCNLFRIINAFWLVVDLGESNFLVFALKTISVSHCFLIWRQTCHQKPNINIGDTNWRCLTNYNVTFVHESQYKKTIYRWGYGET